MLRRGRCLVVTVIAMTICTAVPALAGWRLTWQPSGAISLKLVKVRVPKEDRFIEVLSGIVNPTTGEGRSGNLELRLSGVVIKQFVKPPYYFELPVEQAIYPDKDLLGKIEGQENVAPIMLNDGLDHVFEAWFTVRDSKGRIVRGKQASPTVSFRLDPLAADPAVVASAIEQRFNQAIEQLKGQMAKQKEEYDKEVARLEAEKKAQQERYEKELAEARATGSIQRSPQPRPTSQPTIRVFRNGRPIGEGDLVTVGATQIVELQVERAPSVKKLALISSFEGDVFSRKENVQLNKIVLRMAPDGKGGLVPLDAEDPPYLFKIETEDEAGKQEVFSFFVFVQNTQKGAG